MVRLCIAWLIIGSAFSAGWGRQAEEQGDYVFAGGKSLYIMPDGRPVEVISGGSRVLREHQTIWFLRNELIRRELELDGHQSDRIKRLVMEFDQRQADIHAKRSLIFRSTSFISQDEINRLSRELNQRVVHELDAILLPHQRERFQQLRYRFWIRRIGLFAALVRGPFSRYLQLTDQQKQQLRQQAINLRKSADDEVLRLKRLIRQQLTSPLTAKQREQLVRLTSDLKFHDHLFVGIISAQLHEQPDAWVSDESDLEFRPLAISGKYRIGPDGLFFRIVSRRGEAGKQAFAEIRKAIFSELLTILNDDDVATRLALSEEQKQLYLLLRKSHRTFQEELLSQINQDLRDHSGANVKQIQQRMRSKQTKIAERQIIAIKQSLLPFQRELLDQVVQNIELVRAGLAFALTSGALSQKIGVTDAQGDQLRQRAVKLRGTIAERTGELETDIESKLTGVLTDEQQDRLAQLIGPRIRKIPANLDLLIQKLDPGKLHASDYWRVGEIK